MLLSKNILGIPKIHLVVQNQILWAVFAMWSMKSQMAGIFIGIEISRLIFGRLKLFFKNNIQFYT